MKKDRYYDSAFEQLLDPDTITGNGDDTDSTTLDLLGYEDGADLIVAVGESGDTLSGSLYLEIEVRESDDDSTYAACADKDVHGTVTGANTGTIGVIDDPAEDDVVVAGQYVGSKRYVQVRLAKTGNHAIGTPIAIVAKKLGYKYPPVA